MGSLVWKSWGARNAEGRSVQWGGIKNGSRRGRVGGGKDEEGVRKKVVGVKRRGEIERLRNE